MKLMRRKINVKALNTNTSSYELIVGNRGICSASQVKTTERPNKNKPRAAALPKDSLQRCEIPGTPRESWEPETGSITAVITKSLKSSKVGGIM